jgi:hypothetical protein
MGNGQGAGVLFTLGMIAELRRSDKIGGCGQSRIGNCRPIVYAV